MRLAADGTLLLAPSDLSAHLACPHLTQLSLRVQRGELERPHVDDTRGDLIRCKAQSTRAAYHGVPRLAGDSSATHELLVAKKLSEAE